MADNGAIEQLTPRALTYVVGHDGSGRVGREPVTDFVKATRQVVTDTTLTGGGALSSDLTLGLSVASVASLALANSSLQPGDIGTTVATEAQGAKADTALQQSSNLSDLGSIPTAISNLRLDARYLRLTSRGYYDLQTDFGSPTGSDWTAPFSAMLDACMNDIVPGTIRRGAFNVDSAIVKTFPFTTSVLELEGYGPGSIINLVGEFSTNSNIALQFTYLGLYNAVRMRNLVMQTNSTSGAVVGVSLVCPPGITGNSFAQSTEFDRVTFKGSDGYATGTYFATCIQTMRLNNVFIDLCGFYGPGVAVGDSLGRGTLLDFQSDTGNYAVKYSVTRSKLFQFTNAIRLGNYVQELVLDSSEIVGGSIGVLVPTGQIANDGIIINASHINARTYGAYIQATAATNLSVGAGTYMILNDTNACGVSYAGSYGRIEGSGFALTSGSNTGQAGVRLTSGANRCIVKGNNYTNLTNGNVFHTGSQNSTMEGNQYDNVTTPYVNNGTGNSVGIATT